ncbi:hypothetical protein GTP41_20365 [Pseudoduganella sp. DS3]|uniref:DUF6916 domain-containing protein n=1 Tax=Pseudoduganella guangdongensis TaxID=2692179 RepID=A0A6N9HM60_9BURK|nr:hypothetical protein [Pseudoduganella guangdongensis]MYN04449.1 hypothetical protein [Pseudoduganella guangdongensis]
MSEQAISRRALLKAGGGSLLAAGLGLAAKPAAAADAVAAGDFAWTRALAESLVGQSFWLNHPEHRALSLTLQAVETAQLAPEGGGALQFYVLFSAAAVPAIQAGSYEIEHEATGRQLLFLQPSARQGARVTLRADFNLQA